MKGVQITISEDWMEINVNGLSRHYKIMRKDIDDLLYFKTAKLLVIIGKFEKFKGYIVKSENRRKQRAAFITVDDNTAHYLIKEVS